ncbi:unnamed protein product [Litomosoides sigmodontis]|uniref:Uncharacterized protein n=1 Tax=Litomosoides sigmodontis TaxID=42156 RepID=A0A3P6TEB8_LITSI|nr:unnamed protein product [Litomosoides sigmodontis]
MMLFCCNCFQYQGDEMTVCDADLSLNTLRRKLFRTALSGEANMEDGNERSMAVAIHHSCDQSESFSHERPAWYHSNDDLVSARRVSFDGIDPSERAEIRSRLLSPDISPIKN